MNKIFVPVASRVMPLEQNLLYRHRRNRYLIKPLWRPILTTLILGAKCKDGVVLVGDRKVESDLGTSWTDKIRPCGQLDWVIFGAAGTASLFEEFLTILPQNIGRQYDWIQYQNQILLNHHAQEFGEDSTVKKPPLMIYSPETFKQNCVELLTDMKKRYSVAFSNPYICLEIFIAVQGDPESKLYVMDSENCLPAEVANECIVIGHRQISEVFRKSWTPDMTMKQTAKLGMLTIKYIEREEISDVVGVGEYNPQVWYIPHKKKPYEVKDIELEFLNSEVDKQLERLHATLASLF